MTFVLEPFGKLVKLTLTHDDFAPSSGVIGDISKGWPAMLASLKSLLETGRPLPSGISADAAQEHTDA